LWLPKISFHTQYEQAALSHAFLPGSKILLSQGIHSLGKIVER
jgi:hypothetical protein